MGTMQYYFKGSALAHTTSPNFSAPRVSTLMSQSAVGLDMVNPGVERERERERDGGECEKEEVKERG